MPHLFCYSVQHVIIATLAPGLHGRLNTMINGSFGSQVITWFHWWHIAALSNFFTPTVEITNHSESHV